MLVDVYHSRQRLSLVTQRRTHLSGHCVLPTRRKEGTTSNKAPKGLTSDGPSDEVNIVGLFMRKGSEK